MAILVIFGVYQQIAYANRRAGRIPEINVEQAYEKYQQSAFILDVRQPDEWNEGHIPNATLIPLDQLAHRNQDKFALFLIKTYSDKRIT